MNLESNGYLKAKYHGKIFDIYSEINYEDWTIELKEGNYIFIVKVYEVKLLKVYKIY